MAMNFNKGSSNTSIPQLEKGTYPARIAGIYGIGAHKQTEQNGKVKKEKHAPSQDMIREEVFITFEFPTETITDEEGNKFPRWLSRRYMISMNEKANLYKLVMAVDPKLTITDNGNNPAAMLGLPLNVTVGMTSGNKPKVSAVSPLMKGVTVDELAGDPIFFDLDEATQEDFDNLKPAFIRKVISEGVNFKGTGLVFKEDTDSSDNQSDAGSNQEAPADHPDY